MGCQRQNLLYVGTTCPSSDATPFCLRSTPPEHGFHIHQENQWLTVFSASVRIIQGDVLYQGKQIILGFYLMTRQAVVGLGFLIAEALKSHSGTPNTVGLLWTCDHPRRTDLYLTTQNTRKRKTSMPSAGFEPVTPASERPQTHALDRATTGTADDLSTAVKFFFNFLKIYHVNSAKLF